MHAFSLNLPALMAWLALRVPIGDAQLKAKRMEGGQYNPSWILRGAGPSWVLRARPAPAAEPITSDELAALKRNLDVTAALVESEASPITAIIEFHYLVAEATHN